MEADTDTEARENDISSFHELRLSASIGVLVLILISSMDVSYSLYALDLEDRALFLRGEAESFGFILIKCPLCISGVVSPDGLLLVLRKLECDGELTSLAFALAVVLAAVAVV